MGNSQNIAALAERSFEVASERALDDNIIDLFASGQFAEAASLCGIRIASHPEDHAPYLHLGRLAEIASDYQKAAEFFAEAIVRNVDCGHAYYNLSRMFRNLGQLSHAARALEVAIAMNAAGPEAPLDLADMLFELDDVEGAKRAYATVLQQNPDCGRSKAILKLLAQKAPSIAPTPKASAPLLVPSAWRRVHLVTVAPEGYAHWQGFSDVVRSFAHGLTELGVDCTAAENEIAVEGINILFGAHLMQSQDIAKRLPADAIIFNLEQIGGFGLDRLPVYKSLLSRLAVWDYSPRNIEKLKMLTGNVNIHRVDIGFVESMARVPASWQETTDVLFYGSLNERRIAVLEQLRAAGLNVQHLFNVYGDALDAEIGKAKVVLNMHFYEDSIHEIVRTSFLLANRKAIVSECNSNTEIDADIRQAMRAIPYEELAAACIDLVQNNQARSALQSRGFEIFSKRNQANLLSKVISETHLPT